MKKFFTTAIIVFSLLVLLGCQAEVTFENSGAPSAGMLNQDGNANCLPVTVNGLFVAGTALSGNSNTIRVEVDVASAGSYIIYTDTVNGYYFRATGVFSSTGLKQVTLRGFGTPGAEGSNNFVVHYGSQTCFADVTVFPAGIGNATFTINCNGATVNGTYATGTALGSSNTVVLPVTVTNAGTYSITTTAVNGMVFSGSGGLTPTSTSITLTGSGNPGTAGTSAINVSSGSESCSFNVTVTGSGGGGGGGGGTPGWKFTEGSTTYQGDFDDGMLQTITIPPITSTAYSFLGSNANGVDFHFSLGDINNGINNGETYSTNLGPNNNVNMTALLNGNTIYEANPAISGLTFKVTVSTHNTSTKTITGTFSGTVKDGNGNTKTITGGQFTGTYP